MAMNMDFFFYISGNLSAYFRIRRSKTSAMNTCYIYINRPTLWETPD